MFLKKYRVDLILSAIIFLFALTKRIPGPLQGIFAFNYDQGRDFLAVSKIIYEKDLVLIGQTTGIAGLFYGPWWYYFLTPFFFITKGDPQKIAVLLSIIGSLSVVGIYFFLKNITKNVKVAASLALVCALSASWMLGGVFLWNPTLTPLFFTAFIYCAFKVFETKKSIYYFSLGLFGLLVGETSASFGIFLIIFILSHPIVFPQYFRNYRFLLTIIGGFIIILPRLIFELKNNFIMVKAVVSYMKTITEVRPITERLLVRLDQYFHIFNEGFAKNSINIGCSLLIFTGLIVVIIVNLKKVRNKFLEDKLFQYALLLLTGSFLFFVLVQNEVWDYYLAGLPILYLIILGKVVSYAYEFTRLKKYLILILITLPLLNITKQIFPPYRISWQGDDGTYKNIKLVADYIVSQKEDNYSLQSYSASIFDYPMDYMINWYHKRRLLEKPKQDQDTIILVLREASEKWYIKTGWYLDKTHDRTVILSEKSFPGDMKVEKHAKIK